MGLSRLPPGYPWLHNKLTQVVLHTSSFCTTCTGKSCRHTASQLYSDLRVAMAYCFCHIVLPSMAAFQQLPLTVLPNFSEAAKAAYDAVYSCKLCNKWAVYESNMPAAAKLNGLCGDFVAPHCDA